MARRLWTEEQRQQQSIKIKQWQPWRRSTGPKTEIGKAKSSQNAYKGGMRQILSEVVKLLRKQKQFIDNI